MEDLKLKILEANERITLLTMQREKAAHKKALLLEKVRNLEDIERELDIKLSKESLRQKLLLKSMSSALKRFDCDHENNDMTTISQSSQLLSQVDTISHCEEIFNRSFVDMFFTNAASETLQADSAAVAVTVDGSANSPISANGSISQETVISKLKLFQNQDEQLFCASQISDGSTGDDTKCRTNGPFPCVKCKKEFKQYKNLELHMRSHEETNSVTCDKCKMKFRWLQQLKKHERLHHSGKDAPLFVCHQCNDKDFVTAQRYQNHLRVHSGERPFACEECGKCFRIGTSLRNHRRNVHLGQRDYLCNICGKGCVDPTILKQHMVMHSIRVHQCEVCGKKFTREKLLREHTLVHVVSFNYECGECGKRVRTQRALDRHVITHNQIKCHVCAMCDKRFHFAAYLRGHMRIHTGEKAHVCSECAEKFTSSYNLKTHKAAVHPDVINLTHFPCMHCEKTFMSFSILKSHLLVHTDETPHACDICDKRYKRNVDLRLHKMKLHSDSLQEFY